MQDLRTLFGKLVNIVLYWSLETCASCLESPSSNVELKKLLVNDIDDFWNECFYDFGIGVECLDISCFGSLGQSTARVAYGRK